MVEQNDPQNIEAVFYSAYAKARISLQQNDHNKRIAAFNVLAIVFPLSMIILI